MTPTHPASTPWRRCRCAERWPLARDWIRRAPRPFFAQLRDRRPVLDCGAVVLVARRADDRGNPVPAAGILGRALQAQDGRVHAGARQHRGELPRQGRDARHAALGATCRRSANARAPSPTRPSTPATARSTSSPRSRASYPCGSCRASSGSPPRTRTCCAGPMRISSTSSTTCRSTGAPDADAIEAAAVHAREEMRATFASLIPARLAAIEAGAERPRRQS